MACLVVFDIIGVAMCFYFEVFVSSRQTSAALYYTIWFVLGVFCGVIIYVAGGGLVSPETKGDWTTRGDARKTGLLVILTTSVVLAALSFAFYRLTWRLSNLADSHYVPDSISHSLTFFITIFASTIFGHVTLGPTPVKKAPSKGAPKPTHRK